MMLFRLGAIPPPRAWSLRIPFPLRALFFLLSCVADVDLTFNFFLLFLPFFSISIWTSFVFILSFSCGYYAVSSVSLSAATRLAYDIHQGCTKYLDTGTYVRWSHLFIFVWGRIRFASVIMCMIFCFYLFSSWGNFPLQSYWSLSCDHRRRCSDGLMWKQQQQLTWQAKVLCAKTRTCDSIFEES